MEEFEVEGRIIDEKRGTDGDRTRRSDIVRLLTGAVMLVIPFLGAWWGCFHPIPRSLRSEN